MTDFLLIAASFSPLGMYCCIQHYIERAPVR
jgi:hypothetical protein